jgi:hypothetical protein
MRIDDLTSRIDELLAMGEAVLSTGYSSGGQYNIQHVKPAPMAGFRSVALSFIERTYGSKHPHVAQFTDKTENDFRSDCEAAISILEAIRAEVAGGWLFNIKALVTAEVFADFLSMAEHLLETGYKDPAAVMIGSVLEEHLRQLCLARQMNVDEEKDGRTAPKKADRLNADLAKNAAYSKLDQKLVTAWLDLRNNAAHGKYSLYTEEQVRHMAAGVVEFIARVAS